MTVLNVSLPCLLLCVRRKHLLVNGKPLKVEEHVGRGLAPDEIGLSGKQVRTKGTRGVTPKSAQSLLSLIENMAGSEFDTERRRCGVAWR